ncbi:MAG TPA: HIRAN domain-containing protein [Methanocorpusculum sp.]|nr:HIRAN domain-containing protein [Methanocorpusculum sp.]HJJ39921.1 HIRAN domain-containing protein [Methanocorpusculum sp.]HJJ49126.1 HIRAN domain-containing protein [Methanocorpusculum sp.]HJJ56784.1 HIRAN domain-containing protein [Methanocorpusculum sp.]
MTAQEPDYLIFDNRSFIVIDIEYGKHPETEFIQPGKNAINTTANYRGYEAEYRIVDNRLFGIQIPADETHPVPLHYTGSMLIARKTDDDEFWITDSLWCFLDADEAFELSFEDGMLKNTRNLADACAEMKKIRTSEWWTSESVTHRDRLTVLDDYCRDCLCGSYGHNTYRWMTDGQPEKDRRFRELEERKHQREKDREWVQKLLSYLPLFREKKGNYMKPLPDPPEYPEPSYEIPDKDAERKLSEFEWIFHDSPLADRNYQSHIHPLLSYYPGVERAAQHADKTEIGALITFVFRSYHFGFGDFDEDVETGTFIPLLENLERITDEWYHPWKKTDLRTGDDRFTGMTDRTKDETLPPDEATDLIITMVRPEMGKVLRIIDKTYIAGYMYVNMDSDEYKDRFFKSKPLNLVLEPENQYDKKAVRVEDAEHVKLGYLPKTVNDIPYRLLYGGYRVSAYPISISEGKTKTYNICVIMDVAENEPTGTNRKPSSEE